MQCQLADFSNPLFPHESISSICAVKDLFYTPPSWPQCSQFPQTMSQPKEVCPPVRCFCLITVTRKVFCIQTVVNWWDYCRWCNPWLLKDCLRNNDDLILGNKKWKWTSKQVFLGKMISKLRYNKKEINVIVWEKWICFLMDNSRMEEAYNEEWVYRKSSRDVSLASERVAFLLKNSGSLLRSW